ncbi:MAG: acylphosphatase [Pseudomonadota bacterium]
MSDTRAHVFISGKVQGVWYRAWTVQEAQKRGLRGWVRNLRDGRVEALFVGSDAAVQEMVALCHEGPPLARVEAVTQVDSPPAEAERLGAGFEERPSA